MIHDEKTTELELPPKPLVGVGKSTQAESTPKAEATAYTISSETAQVEDSVAADQWVLRIALLIGVLSLSLLLL